MLTKILLSPFSLLYTLVVLVRLTIFNNFSFLRFKASVPVICLGNISAGGSGKTPIGLHLAKTLAESKKVGILLRGYKSESNKPRPLLVEVADNAKEVGDEALLYKTLIEDKVSVVISPNRKEGLKNLLDLGAEVIIMDDGLQHLKVKPSLPICIIEVSDLEEINNPSILDILPSGRLREWPSWTLSRSDVVIFTKKSKFTTLDKEKVDACVEKYRIKNHIEVELIADSLYDAVSKEAVSLNESDKPSLFSTIARPKLLEKNLEEMGIQIKDKMILPDHTPIDREEWIRIKSKLSKPIICTEKDLVKILRFLEKRSEVLVLKQEIRELEDSGITLDSLKSRL